jgi:hypothetical protein
VQPLVITEMVPPWPDCWSKLAALDRQRAQKEAERATPRPRLPSSTRPSPPPAADGYTQGLVDKEVVSKITYLETLHQLVEQQQERNKERNACQGIGAISQPC